MSDYLTKGSMIRERFLIHDIIDRSYRINIVEDTDQNSPYFSQKLVLKHPHPDTYHHGPIRGLLHRESQIWSKISGHPNVVNQIYELSEFSLHLQGQTVYVPFMILEYVDRGSIKDFVERDHKRRPLAYRQTLVWARQVAEGMKHCTEGVTECFAHRDMDWSNILVSSENLVKINDWGFGKDVNEMKPAMVSLGDLADQKVPGKPAFMPPEQFVRGSDASYGVPGDIYYLGSILVATLWGRALNPSSAWKIYKKGQTPLREIQSAFIEHQKKIFNKFRDQRPLPDEFMKFLSKTVHPDENNRYKSFSDVLFELEGLLEHEKKKPKETEIMVCDKCGFYTLLTGAICPLCRNKNTLVALMPRSHFSLGDYNSIAPEDHVEDIAILFQPSLGYARYQQEKQDESPAPFDIDPNLFPNQEEPAELETPKKPEGKAKPKDEEEMRFCRIPAGEYMIGCSEQTARKIVDRFNLGESSMEVLLGNPERLVRMPHDFQIAKYAVTNKEYHAFIKDIGHPHPVQWNPQENPPFGSGLEYWPVTGVTFDDTLAYCRWAGLRLPTDEEWEVAARGTEALLYPWGNHFDPDRCNTSESHWNRLIPVDELDEENSSPFGCAQLVGNCWEWVRPTKLEQAMMRGGAFDDNCKFSGIIPLSILDTDVSHVQNNLGFRVVTSRVGKGHSTIRPKDHLLVRISQGPFIQGCPENKASYVKSMAEQFGYSLDRLSQREVNLETFYISKYPITNEEYFRFYNDVGYKKPLHWFKKRDPFPKAHARMPVTNISFEDATAFARWLGPDFRLPNGLEWEKAARGHDGRIYPWGNTFDPSKCNCREGGAEELVPVDAYPECDSPYGVSQMVGNVWEWVDQIRNKKGGSYQYSCEVYGLASFTMRLDGTIPSSDVGFRCVKD